MGMERIIKLTTAVLFLLSEAESRCFVPLACSNQPAWLDVSSICSSSIDQSNFSTTIKDLEGELQDLWAQLRQLNDTIYKAKAGEMSVQSSIMEEDETTTMTSGAGDTPSGCKTSFNFTEDSHKFYVRFKETVPNLDSFTACVWISPLPGQQQVTGSLISYCVGNSTNCNSLVLRFKPDKVEIKIEGKKIGIENLLVVNRTHLCIVKSMADERIYFYYNGTEQMQKNLNKHLSGGGVFIIGQDQDGPLNGNDIGQIHEATDGFTGFIEDFYLWNRAFTPDEITSAFQSPCSCPTDASISFTSTTSIISGDVIANYSMSC